MMYKKNGGVAPCSGKAQCSSIRDISSIQYQKREVGRGGWENRGREEGLWDLGEWGARKGEII